MMKVVRILLLAGATLAFAGEANASPSNNPPPAGSVILDLAGTPIIGTYTQYSATFTGNGSPTNISFAFREDPAFLILDDVSVTDTTTSSGNLILNGDFELGPNGANQPTDWTYLNTFGASFAGVVNCTGGLGHSASSCAYDDGAVQAYDGITQQISTNLGDSYSVTFWLFDSGATNDVTGAPLLYQQLSTNGDITDTGGNGRDLLVYAGTVPVEAPEPLTLSLFGAGLAGAVAIRRRKKHV